MKNAAKALATQVQGLTGLDKASILMLSLPDAQVTDIFQKLHSDEVQLLSKHMANLGSVPAESVEALYIEFADRVGGTGSVYGNFSATESLLSKIFNKDKVDDIMQEIRGPAGRTMWDKLSNVNEEVLASYLKNESPQTVAVIMSKVKPDHSARVLSLLPNEFSTEIVSRMLKMESINKDVLEDIEYTLRGEFINNLAAASKEDPHEQMAEIFNAFDRQTEERFMSSLEESNSESAEKIKSLMFTFDDLVKLDSPAVQTVIRLADKAQIALGLKGASEAIKELFFGNMSERAAKLMREDMENMGPVKLKEVDEAQSGVVLKVKELVDSGEITISDGDDDEEMVE